MQLEPMTRAGSRRLKKRSNEDFDSIEVPGPTCTLAGSSPGSHRPVMSSISMSGNTCPLEQLGEHRLGAERGFGQVASGCLASPVVALGHRNLIGRLLDGRERIQSGPR